MHENKNNLEAIFGEHLSFRNGCSICLLGGEYCPQQKKVLVPIIEHEDVQLRSSRAHARHQRLGTPNVPVHGVKGKTLLSKILDLPTAAHVSLFEIHECKTALSFSFKNLCTLLLVIPFSVFPEQVKQFGLLFTVSASTFENVNRQLNSN